MKHFQVLGCSCIVSTFSMFIFIHSSGNKVVDDFHTYVNIHSVFHAHVLLYFKQWFSEEEKSYQVL